MKEPSEEVLELILVAGVGDEVAAKVAGVEEKKKKSITKKISS